MTTITPQNSPLTSPPPHNDPSNTNTNKPPTPQALSSCHWDWCTETFSTRALLRDHVENEHIAFLMPVRTGDLKIWRRAEGSFGDSTTFSHLWLDSQSSRYSSQGRGKAKEKEKETVDRAIMTDVPGDTVAVPPSTPTTTPTTALVPGPISTSATPPPLNKPLRAATVSRHGTPSRHNTLGPASITPQVVRTPMRRSVTRSRFTTPVSKDPSGDGNGNVLSQSLPHFLNSSQSSQMQSQSPSQSQSQFPSQSQSQSLSQTQPSVSQLQPQPEPHFESSPQPISPFSSDPQQHLAPAVTPTSRFAALRGRTPSPAPSHVPNSPGTAALVQRHQPPMLFSPVHAHSLVRNTVVPVGYSPSGSVVDGGGRDADAEMSFEIDPDSSLDVVESQLTSGSERSVLNMDVDVDRNGNENVIGDVPDSQWRPVLQLPFSIDPTQLQICTTELPLLSSPIKTPTQSQNRNQKAFLDAVSSAPNPSQRQSQSPSRSHLHPDLNPPPSSSTLDISNVTGSRSPEVIFAGVGSGSGNNAMTNASHGSDMSISQADVLSSPHFPRSQRQSPSLFAIDFSQSDSMPVKSANGLDMSMGMGNGSSQAYSSGDGDGQGESQMLQTQVMGVGAFGASWESDG